MLSRWPRLPNVQPLQGGHGQECQLQQHSGCRRVDGRVQISLLRQVRIEIDLDGKSDKKYFLAGNRGCFVC